MNATNAASVARLNELRSVANESLLAVSLASQDGTLADWHAARAVSKVACAAVSAEVARLTEIGFGLDAGFEIAVTGRLLRRHVDPCVVTFASLR